jgi:hypothetical protein
MNMKNCSLNWIIERTRRNEKRLWGGGNKRKMGSLMKLAWEHAQLWQEKWFLVDQARDRGVCEDPFWRGKVGFVIRGSSRIPIYILTKLFDPSIDSWAIWMGLLSIELSGPVFYIFYKLHQIFFDLREKWAALFRP